MFLFIITSDGTIETLKPTPIFIVLEVIYNYVLVTAIKSIWRLLKDDVQKSPQHKITMNRSRVETLQQAWEEGRGRRPCRSPERKAANPPNPSASFTTNVGVIFS